jgi:1-acyl-sn-glycerol-3-phosphate acyltransferase
VSDAGVPLPKPWAVRFFTRYFRRLFARHFAHVRWHALDDWRAWGRDVPILAIANHSNWWDGFHSVLLTEEMGYTCHVMMEAVNLDRYPPFRWIGTLPVRRDSPRGAYEDLVDYGRRLVPGRMCWIYPQGERRPALEPPTRLERGAAQLALGHAGPLRIVPVAFRYPFTSEQLPDAYALVGRSWLHAPREGDDRRALSARFGEALVEVVGELDARLREERLGDFRDLVPGRLSINKRMDLVRHKLGLLGGDFEARNG